MCAMCASLCFIVSVLNTFGAGICGGSALQHMPAQDGPDDDTCALCCMCQQQRRRADAVVFLRGLAAPLFHSGSHEVSLVHPSCLCLSTGWLVGWLAGCSVALMIPVLGCSVVYVCVELSLYACVGTTPLLARQLVLAPAKGGVVVKSNTHHVACRCLAALKTKGGGVLDGL